MALSLINHSLFHNLRPEGLKRHAVDGQLGPPVVPFDRSFLVGRVPLLK